MKKKARYTRIQKYTMKESRRCRHTSESESRLRFCGYIKICQLHPAELSFGSLISSREPRKISSEKGALK